MPDYAPTTTARSIDPNIVSDIRRASHATNIDFAYLMAQAAQESSFQPNAKAATSSATGLYQFVDKTWLGMVKQFGDKYGLSQYASRIQQSGGSYHVADPAVRQQILDLRKDPSVSASLAAEFAKQNKQDVEQALGHPANSTDLYLAHFLGAQGATELVKTIESHSSVKAADLLPEAAAANHAVFYDHATGQPKTVAQIYKSFSEKLETQISQFGGTVGDDAEVTLASDDVAGGSLSQMPADLSNRLNQPMLAMMNVIAVAALKLLGQDQPADSNLSPESQDKQKQQAAGTSA
jgi:hypothetical protein